MNNSVVLDTNVIIAHFRNDPDLTAHLAKAGAIYLPWVVLGELHYGALRAQRPEAQLTLIADFRRLGVTLLPDQSTTEYYGQIKAELAERGKLIPDNDTWIAAIARQYDLPSRPETATSQPYRACRRLPGDDINACLASSVSEVPPGHVHVSCERATAKQT